MFDRYSDRNVDAVDVESVVRCSQPMTVRLREDVVCSVACTTIDVAQPGDRIPAAVDTRTRSSLAMALAEVYCFLR